MPKIEVINTLPPIVANAEFLRCCGSKRWAEKMTTFRPYPDEATLFETADRMWTSLTSEDWIEAFSHHPKIGGATTSKWTSEEQSGVRGTSSLVLSELEKENRLYEQKFGFVFLVCATGKTAAEMLSLLRERMKNDAVVELQIAVREQAKITRLRLEKWLKA